MKDSLYSCMFCSDGTECTITQYTGTKQPEIDIPAAFDGALVTSIGKYAFAKHMELTYIRLPRDVRMVGAHAFYNCRNLQIIWLCDGIVDMGDGAFKNCANVREIVLENHLGNMKVLRALMEEMNQELKVTVRYPDGEAVLLFPYYIYEYEENTPGRIINQVTIGSGVHYRECIGAADIDYAQYDNNFGLEKNIDVNEAGWKVAYYRLLAPYRLAPDKAEQYREYLQQELYKIAGQLLEGEHYEELLKLLDMAVQDRSQTEKIVEMARKSGRIKAVGLLMSYEKRRFQTEKKIYDFG